MAPRKRTPAVERVERRCVYEDRGHSTPCRIFTGSLNDGYGQVYGDDGRMTRVHRLMYQHYVGGVPDGLILDHICRQKDCCEVTHLEPVTHLENLMRSPLMLIAKETCGRGHPLTDDNVYLDRPIRGRRARHCKTCKREWQKRRPPRQSKSA